MIVGPLHHNYTLHTDSHKFNHDGLAEFVFDQLTNDEDEGCGDSDYGFACRYGKRILWGDSDGNVALQRFDSVGQAIYVFARAESAFIAWLEGVQDIFDASVEPLGTIDS